MMIIKLLNVDFPVDFILRTVFNCYWEISSIVEKSELRNWNMSSVDSSGNWLLRNWLQLGAKSHRGPARIEGKVHITESGHSTDALRRWGNKNPPQ